MISHGRRTLVPPVEHRSEAVLSSVPVPGDRKALRRRNQILALMAGNGYILEEGAAAAPPALEGMPWTAPPGTPMEVGHARAVQPGDEQSATYEDVPTWKT